MMLKRKRKRSFVPIVFKNIYSKLTFAIILDKVKQIIPCYSILFKINVTDCFTHVRTVEERNNKTIKIKFPVGISLSLSFL